MSAMPPEQMRSMRNPAREQAEPLGSPEGSPKGAHKGSLAQRWEDLHRSAAQLAGVAGLAPEPFTGKPGAFAAYLNAANDWQSEMASRGIDDIDAMLQPGLAALGALEARGQDASVPAQALWREFHHAREAVLAVVEPLHA